MFPADFNSCVNCSPPTTSVLLLDVNFKENASTVPLDTNESLNSCRLLPATKGISVGKDISIPSLYSFTESSVKNAVSFDFNKM